MLTGNHAGRLLAQKAEAEAVDQRLQANVAESPRRVDLDLPNTHDDAYAKSNQWVQRL